MLPNLPELFVIFALISVIVIQALDKFAANEQFRSREKELIAGILSKTVTDFTVAVKEESKRKPLSTVTDEVELSSATDEAFDKFIEEQIK